MVEKRKMSKEAVSRTIDHRFGNASPDLSDAGVLPVSKGVSRMSTLDPTASASDEAPIIK